MLKLVIQASEKFDEVNQEFVVVPQQTLMLEHSLVSVSKWESKWGKPFLGKEPKTLEETIDYIKCMTLTQNVKDEVYYFITNEHINQVNEYIAAPMTATWFNDKKTKRGNTTGEIVTSELIYYWMIALNIPVEFQKWHLNRLLTLIKVCNIKNSPAKKMNKREILSRNKALNEIRKANMGTQG